MPSSVTQRMSPSSLSGMPGASDMLGQQAAATASVRKGSNHSYQQTTRTINGGNTTLADVVHSLVCRGGDDMTASRVADADYASLLEWIRCERMKKLPPEGSNYDRALVWAALFVERVHSFDSGIEQFAGDSHLAAQLAYCYCSNLLELGEQNAPALMNLFGFFYRCSAGLGNLLDRAELFVVSLDIKDQLILALADLVTLVVCIATHFHRSLLASESVSIDIYSTFPESIDTFRGRCDQVSELMWRHQLTREGHHGDEVVGISTLKEWLEPEDPVLAHITEATIFSTQGREPATCLWMKPCLTRFLKGEQQLLSITGRPGSGRSVLSTVINDHLQHPIGGMKYTPILASINGRIPATTTPLAIAKTILSQIFSKRIGNVQLYQILASAYDQGQRCVDEASYDDVLWNALTRALQASQTGARGLVLIVDGVDEASGGERFLLRLLHEAASNAPTVKLVVLASQTLDSAISHMAVQITPELIFEDIATVTRGVFHESHAFNAMSEGDQELTIARITEASNGSFLWAKLAAKRVRDEHLAQENRLFTDVESIVREGYTIADLVTHALQSKLDEDGKVALLWLATAARPLTHRELTALVSIQPSPAAIAKRRDVDIDLSRLLKPVASLIFFQNNLIYLRHEKVRVAILDFYSKGKFLPAIKNRHVEFVQRLLQYVKQGVTDSHDPSVVPLDRQTTEGLLQKYPLLDFALRYWANHVKIAFGCTSDQEFIMAGKELRSVLPTNPAVPLLEMNVWANKTIPSLRLIHGIQTRLYRQILDSTHPATLQTILSQALFYRRIHMSVPTESSKIFYEAAITSHTVLSVQNLITMQMIQFFLEATEDQITESQTEVMTWRIEMLKLLVECYKVHYGATNALVTSTLMQLSEHYRLIKEDRKAQEITASLQVAVADNTTQRRGSRQIDDSLLVHLHGRKDMTTAVTGNALALNETETDDLITWSFDLESLLAKAERQMAQGQVEEAERTYVELWEHANREYRLSHSTEHKVKTVQATLAYAQFLKHQQRENEAASVLAGFWEEHEKTISSSEALVSQFLQLAQIMKSVGLLILALDVLKHCAQITSSRSAIYREVEQHMKSTSREVMRMVATSSTTSTSVMMESSLKDMVYHTSTFDQVSTTATTTLVDMYLFQHRWHDATRVLKQVLRSVWPAMFALSVEDVVLPSAHIEYCVELAERLAGCYRFRRLPIKEEDIRARLYRAVRRDRPASGDRLLERVTTSLLRLYERTSQTDKIITVHQNILNDYVKRFGDEHPTVIQKLWTLADLTRPRPIAVDYYRQIVNILNKDLETCHPDAFEPLLIVQTELLNQGRYANALKPSQVLFSTLQHPTVSKKLRDQAFVRTIYERYVYCQRMVYNEAAVIHDATVQYREACISLFGANASITIQATKTLANICQESKEYDAEAIQLYEELLQIKSSEVDLDYEDIRATLDAIYEQKTASLIASREVNLTAKELQKVVSVRTKALSSTRSSNGWAHEKALSQMEEIVLLYTKQGKWQAAESMLQEAMVQVLSAETSSVKLTAAAKSIASGYTQAGQITRAKELSREVYRQIVVKEVTHATAFGFDLSSSRQASLVFLAQFEYSLQERDAPITLNEIYSALIAEYLYFEQFRTLLGSHTGRLHNTAPKVARLHAFLLERGRQSAADQVVDKYTGFFLATEESSLNIESQQAKIFIKTVLDYFSSHNSHNFLRSVAIASYNRASQLLESEDYQSACHLALAALRYIGAHQGYSTPATLKLVFKLGLLIAGREIDARPAPSVKKYMLTVSAAILSDTLGHFKEHNFELAQLDLVNINSLIGVLDEQHDYRTLAWVLNSLWNRRDTQASSQPQHAYSLALGRMLVITRFLIGDYMAATHLAEDLVYNCARVHGPRHASTVEMTILLSQMYTSMAQGYQSQKGRHELAYRYYRKAAAVHENALRVFVDPSSASATEMDTEVTSGLSSPSSAANESESAEEGKYVRQHLHMLKLAVERLGNWPKEYSEYERLSQDLFRIFATDLKGVDGIDKWNLQVFGSGRAEASDDLLSSMHERLAITV